MIQILVVHGMERWKIGKHLKRLCCCRKVSVTSRFMWLKSLGLSRVRFACSISLY